MKQRLFCLVKRNQPFFFGVLGCLFGTLFLAIVGQKALATPSAPLLSALSTETPALSFVADYAGEVRLFLPMALVSLLVRHPLPAYSLLFTRGFFCGFSSACLFAWGYHFSFCVVYLVLHVAILISYAAMVYCLLPHLAQARKKQRAFAFPFLYYSGIVFLLTVIRNLVYCLCLKK